MVWKEQLQMFYGKYSSYIDKGLRLILGLLVFGAINLNIGFTKQAASVFVTVGLSVICTFLPLIVMTILAAGLILIHFYSAILAGGTDHSGRIFDYVYFLFQIYTEESLANLAYTSCICVKDPVCDPGCFWSGWNTGFCGSGSLRNHRILYAPLCKRSFGSTEKLRDRQHDQEFVGLHQTDRTE